MSLAHLCVCICILRAHTHIHTHTHELPILEHCSTSFKTVNKAEMPGNHIQMPGETCLLPEEMPAAAATIQEGTCCIVYNPPALTLHCQCSPRRASQEFSISLSVTLSNKCSCIRNRHEDKVPLSAHDSAHPAQLSQP